MIEAARAAVRELRKHLEKEEREAIDEAERQRLRELGEKQRQAFLTHRDALASLRTELDAMAVRMGTQAAGYAFQTWFGRLVSLFELPYRKPYVNSDGRQIDGGITVDGMRYLLELKFSGRPTEPREVSDFRDKVEGVADYTMGIMLSMPGFTKDAKLIASRAKTSILLMDHTHLYLVLSGGITLGDLVARLKTHASDTGQAYLPVGGGG